MKIDLQKRLLEFQQEKYKTDDFLYRNRKSLTKNYRIIPDKADDVLQQEQNFDNILHPITTENLDKICLIQLKDIGLMIDRFKELHQKIRGLPQFMDNFLRGNPCQEREIFYKQPKQTELVKCDDCHFLIQPTPTYNDISLRDTDDKLTAYGKYTIPPRICAWFIDNDYINHKEDYPILDALCDNNKQKALQDKLSQIHTTDKLALRYGEIGTSQRKFADSHETSPDIRPPHRRFSFSKIKERSTDIQTNQMREQLTGEKYLSTVFFLEPKKHLKMLKELKENALKYMKKTYGITQETHPELDMYFHYPYLEKTSTLHLHVVCKKIPTDLKTISIDELVSCFEKNGTVQDIVTQKYKEIGGLNFDPEPVLVDELLDIIGHDNVIGGQIMFMPLEETKNKLKKNLSIELS